MFSMNTRRNLLLAVVVLAFLVGSALATRYLLVQRARPTPVASLPAGEVLKPPADLAGTVAPAPSGDPAPPKRQKPGPKDPLAREALQKVGADPEATAYWIQAINDPKLPRDERKDLIEDLNEDGFTDKKRPALEELPLVEARIELLELLAPHAMDEVNARAFQEAYKDLLKIRSRLTGQPLDTVPRLAR